MIDWHNHILPGVDDGSSSDIESVRMLEMQAIQGVNTVIATPHFYANDESAESFFQRRGEAFEILKDKMHSGLPRIILGAEVRYYQGISKLNELKSFCIEGSKLLLLEMPMAVWSEYMIRELVELSSENSLKIILAHGERYIKIQSKEVYKRLLESDILMQVSADYFTSFSTKRRALSLLGEGYVHFIGSDCHNTTSRPPNIGKAFDTICKKFGVDFLNQMNEYGKSMLNYKK